MSEIADDSQDMKFFDVIMMTERENGLITKTSLMTD